MFTPLKQVEELDGNIYVSMEYCNNEINARDKRIRELENDLDFANSQLSYLAKIHIKALKYIKKIRENKIYHEDTVYYIEKILLGSDKK